MIDHVVLADVEDEVPSGGHKSNECPSPDMEVLSISSYPANGKSLFDEALSDEESKSVSTASQLEQGRSWLAVPSPTDSDETPRIPNPPFATVPTPIQHGSLQRQALQFSYGDTNTNEEEDDSQDSRRPRSLSQLVAAVRKGQASNENKEITAIERRLKDFERARWMRHNKTKNSPPWGILGLFEHLSGVRTDLKWAEYAAYRRGKGQPYAGWADFVKEHDQSYHRPPYFIIFIVLVSTIMMFYTMYLGDWKFAPMKVNPMIGPSPQALIEAGALNSSLVVVYGQWYRLFAPLVLHAGIIHFVFNMLAILFIGGPLEKMHGLSNISCLFVISAVGGNILSAVFQPNVISVGASGGIFGLVGVCLADIFVNWDLLFLTVDKELQGRTPCDNFQVLLWLLLDVVINIVIGLTPFVDNFAHMGGLLYGIFYALPLADRLGLHFFGRKSMCFRMTSCSLRLFGFLAGFGLLITSTLLLMRSDGYNSPCEQCRFISCAPFPFWVENKWWDCSSNH